MASSSSVTTVTTKATVNVVSKASTVNDVNDVDLSQYFMIVTDSTDNVPAPTVATTVAATNGSFTTTTTDTTTTIATPVPVPTSTLRVDSSGNKEYYDAKGRLHRTDRDANGMVLPAAEYVDGTKKYCVEGRLHRDPVNGVDMPAIDSPKYKAWYINADMKRTNLNDPVEEWFDDSGKRTSYKRISNGAEIYYNANGQLHRDGDLPAIVYGDGRKSWYRNGEYYRDGDQPADIFPSGSKYWQVGDQFHRAFGPAVVRADGTKSWYHNGNIVRQVSAIQKYSTTEPTSTQVPAYYVYKHLERALEDAIRSGKFEVVAKVVSKMTNDLQDEFNAHYSDLEFKFEVIDSTWTKMTITAVKPGAK